MRGQGRRSRRWSEDGERIMFAWTRTFYAEKNGIYYNFDWKRCRDDAVKNHGMRRVSAKEAYKHFRKVIQIPWEQYEERIKYI